MRGKIEEYNLLIKFLICEPDRREYRLKAIVYKILFRWDEESKGVGAYPTYTYIKRFLDSSYFVDWLSTPQFEITHASVIVEDARYLHLRILDCLLLFIEIRLRFNTFKENSNASQSKAKTMC